MHWPKLAKIFSHKEDNVALTKDQADFELELAKQEYRRAMRVGGGIPFHIQGGISNSSPVSGAGAGSEPEWSGQRLLQMINSRLHVHESARGIKAEHVSAYKSGEEVFFFFVKDGKPGYLVDEWPMFPSDQFMTALRLITG